MGLNIELSDDDADRDFDNLMPPTRDQHAQKYGDTLLGQYDDIRPTATKEEDEAPPKPTADVLMSRNLRGGVQKGFNFAFSDDEEDSPSPRQENSAENEDEDEEDDSDQNDEDGQ